MLGCPAGINATGLKSHPQTICLGDEAVVCFLAFHVPATCPVKLRGDLLGQLYLRPHSNGNCSSKLLFDPVTVYGHRASQL